MRRRAGLSRPRARGGTGLSSWSARRKAAAAVGLLAVLGLTSIVIIAATLPDPENVSLHLGEIKMLDRHGRLIADVGASGVQRREASITDISPLLQHATVAAEDRHFYENRLLGIDFGRLLKASTIDLIRRQPAQGASTITQQLARIELL